MAITLEIIKGYMDDLDLNYEVREENEIVTVCSDGDDKIMIIIQLLENGEYLRMRTLQHLDDLVAEASEEDRIALLKWMLNKNYVSKLGTWEYDPDDHDHHLAIGHSIEDGDLTAAQFNRLIKVIMKSVEYIPEMKTVLGIKSGDSDLSEKEKKRKELLEQLQSLDDGGI